MGLLLVFVEEASCVPEIRAISRTCARGKIRDQFRSLANAVDEPAFLSGHDDRGAFCRHL